MVEKRSLTDAQARHAMTHGEFDESVTAAAANVAVLLSQDWCAQYTALAQALDGLASGSDPAIPRVTVFELLYNRVDYFESFMKFKETTWRNYQIPYVRYYRHGKLVGESNYVAPQAFLSYFKE
jgi:hypothetical protein